MLQAAAREREVTLTTQGRASGKPRRVTVWLATDGRRIFIRSGQGLVRHWPQNLMARDEGALRLGKREVTFKPRHVTDAAEARAVSELYRRKYGSFVKPSKPSEALTPGELASFELLPA
jgi:deazaflavin-dependent oxidoreductase (nitroreductase family)